MGVAIIILIVIIISIIIVIKLLVLYTSEKWGTVISLVHTS